MNMQVAEITVPTRSRKDMGNLSSLVASIREVGLLEPIGVTTKGELCYGARRLEAVKSLGWSEVPVVLVDLANPLLAERDENTVRKDFTPSELVAIGRRIEEREAKLAKARQARPGQARTSSSRELDVQGQARDKAAKAVGMSPTSYHRAQAVVAAAEADPSLDGLINQMDAGTVSINSAYKEVRGKKKQKQTKGRGEVEVHLRLVDQRGSRPSGLTLKKSHQWLTDATGTIKGYSRRMAELHENGSLPALYLVGDSQQLFDDLIESVKILHSTVRRMERERTQAHVTHAGIGRAGSVPEVRPE